MSVWLYVTVLLLWTKSGGCMEKANASNLIEFTAADFYEKLHSGKMIFMYFQREVSPSISLFLLELEKSADMLRDYGVLVGMVNCNKDTMIKYCSEDKVLLTAFLFRSGKEFLSFDLDTVFDVNAIVSEVLFAILRDEVRYVHTEADLLAMEKSVIGLKDIVLAYVSSLGTEEHRSIMETAFVYGSTYQFILITGGPVLKHLGYYLQHVLLMRVNLKEFAQEGVKLYIYGAKIDLAFHKTTCLNNSPPSAGVWVLHCKDHTIARSTKSSQCPLTRMRKPLSTLNLHSFLQLINAPLLTEMREDPSKITLSQFAPQVFLFAHHETEDMDKETARTLALELRGLAQVVLIHREGLSAHTLKQYNAAYRMPGQELEYLTLHSIQDVRDLFTNRDTETEAEEVDHFEDEDIMDQLDDEVASSVYLNRGNELDMDVFTELDTQNFHSVVAQSSLTVALFYLKWDAVSMAFLEPFVEIAESLLDGGADDVQMCAVNCGEWTDLCAAQSGASDPLPFQPITAFPTVLILRPKEPALRYSGMLSSRALYRFILLSRVTSPLILNDDDLTRFMSGAIHPDLLGQTVDKVLGLFHTHAHPVFVEAARAQRGELLTGLMTDDLALKWASHHQTALPAVLVFPSWRTDGSPSVLPLAPSAQELTSLINTALLQPVPELTVASLPALMLRGRPLLLLFVAEEEDHIGLKQNRAMVAELETLVQTGGTEMEEYSACWIHLGRTPAGIDVLGSYLGSVPPLPSLILAHNPSAAEVYQYPPRQPITAAAVIRWLRLVQDGREQAAGTLAKGNWPPASPFYDFLAVMDKNDPSSAQQQIPKQETAKDQSRGEETEVNVVDGVTLEGKPGPGPGPNQHTEL